jgi:hypothetical protein
MSYDPYRYPDVAGGDLTAVKARVTPAAVAMLVVSVLNVLLALGGLFVGFTFSQMPADRFEKMLADSPNNRGQLDEWKRQGHSTQDLLNIYIYSGFGGGLVALVAALLTLLGSVRMLMLKTYGLAVFSSVLMVVPCVSPSACCLLGMGIGIWSLVILFQPDVRSAFNREGRGGPDYGDYRDPQSPHPGPERFNQPGPPYPDRPSEPPYGAPGPNG